MCDAVEEETLKDGHSDQNKQASLQHKCFFRKELQDETYLKDRKQTRFATIFTFLLFQNFTKSTDNTSNTTSISFHTTCLKHKISNVKISYEREWL